MGRVGLADLDKYSSGGGGNFFQLKKDKEVARVRIMVNKLEDMEDYLYACHRVDVAGSQWGRNVNCLRAYNEPLSKCPFCDAGLKPQVRVFIPLYNEDAKEVQIWERGKSFMSTLSGFISRYAKPTMVSHIVEIERNGKEHDQKTTYSLYEQDKDDTRLEDLPEVPEILGSIVLDKTADDMNYYLDSGEDHEFPPEDEPEVRRRGSRREGPEDEFINEPENDAPFEGEDEEEQPRRRESRRSEPAERSGRRTPASGGSRRRSY